MILSQVITLSLLQVASATPYYDFLYRLEEFKTRALDGGGCGWWRDVLRLHFRHEEFCEEGLLDKIHDLDDFEMAGLSWIVSHEWRNPLLSDSVKVIITRNITNISTNTSGSKTQLLLVKTKRCQY